jgi:hypothetical protein
MKIKKFNELFNGGKITLALKKDLSDGRLTHFFGDIQKKLANVFVIGCYNKKEERFDSVSEAIDYVLDNFRSDSHKKPKTVDISEYAITKIEDLGKDYGFESAYIGLSKDSDSLNFEILISDKRYISRLKKIFYNTPALFVGELKFKGK